MGISGSPSGVSGGVGSIGIGGTSGAVRGGSGSAPGGTGVTFSNSIQYYLNLFTSQYKLSPNLQAFQTQILTPLNDMGGWITLIGNFFNLDTATGVHLDRIGQLLGQSRTVAFQPSGGVSPVLTDADYKTLLYATLANNHWDGRTASLYPIWQLLFPAGVLIVVDNQNMTCNIITRGILTSIQQDLITNGYIVPRPEGVLYNFNPSSGVLFGFDLDNSVIAGFDTGLFA